MSPQNGETGEGMQNPSRTWRHYSFLTIPQTEPGAWSRNHVPGFERRGPFRGKTAFAKKRVAENGEMGAGIQNHRGLGGISRLSARFIFFRHCIGKRKTVCLFCAATRPFRARLSRPRPSLGAICIAVPQNCRSFFAGGIDKGRISRYNNQYGFHPERWPSGLRRWS